MAEARYETTTPVDVPRIWDFVRDMDQWACFVTGYQHHEKKSESESLWTLKGDLGVMSRTLIIEVLITEWNGPSRVRFALRGVNEPMAGEGCFTIETAGDAAARSGAPVRAQPRPGPLARVLEAFWRRLLGLVGGRPERTAPAAAAPGASLSRMVFELRLDPGGPMAPMVNAMIKPMLLPAAQQLADKILAHLEGAQGREGATR